MLDLGRLGQLYVVIEGSYGVHPGHASADAIRHITFKPSYDPKNKRNSTEKKQSPGRAVRFDGRESAGGDLTTLLRPSGTINTLPEASEILEASFGSKSSVVLSTTVASGGAVGGATLTSGTGLVVNGGVLITCPDGKKRIRRLASVAGGVVTWTPNLPAGQQPANGAAVKGLITYSLTTGLAVSLAASHYLKKTDGSSAGMKRGLLGWTIDKFSLNLDANEEAQIQVNGPAATQTTSTTPAQPGAFTTVGGNPPSGLTSELLVGNNAVKWLKLAMDMTNGQMLRNDEGGQTRATEAFRHGYREIAVGLDTHVEDETLIYDFAEVETDVPVFVQQGFTEGMCFALALPQVEFKIPDMDDGDDTLTWPFKGMVKESADGANDEAFLYIA